MPSYPFTQPCSKKYHHLFLWCLILKTNEFLNCNICFLEKQADLKINCTRLWCFVLMIAYNMLTQKYCFHWWFKSIFKIVCSSWQLWKLEKPFVLFATSKTQTERLFGKWQIDNFGAHFCWKERLKESGNWIVFFLKEKITLIHLKLVRSSDPRVRL